MNVCVCVCVRAAVKHCVLGVAYLDVHAKEKGYAS